MAKRAEVAMDYHPHWLGAKHEAVTDTAHLPKEGVPQPRESCKVIESSTVISVIPGKDFKADMTVLRQQG